MLLSISSEGTAKLWHTRAAKCIWQHRKSFAYDGEVNSAVFSLSDELVLTSCSDVPAFGMLKLENAYLS